VTNVPGDFVECGVGNGRSLTLLCHYAAEQGRRVYGYDSFEGFPAPSREDTSTRNPRKGEWNHISVATTTWVLRHAGFSTDWIAENVELRKGFFNETVSQHTNAISFLHIDADLYQSYVDALPLYRLVSPGGVILFDDYGLDEWPGATKAVDEFVAREGLELQYEATMSRHYVIKPSVPQK
jgi:O-methyltransferase